MSITTSGGTPVVCLTENDDGTISVRLHPRSTAGSDGHVVLEEPTATEYATLRTQIVGLDDEINQKFPPLADVNAVLGDLDPTSAAGLTVLTEYQRTVNEWVKDRRDYLRALETAPYARQVIIIIEKLAGVTVTLDDLTAEVFNPLVCGALLEAWERPLDGRASRAAKAATPEPDPELVPAPAPAPTVDTAPASPELEPSSPPGTEPSTPSPLPS